MVAVPGHVLRQAEGAWLGAGTGRARGGPEAGTVCVAQLLVGGFPFCQHPELDECERDINVFLLGAGQLLTSLVLIIIRETDTTSISGLRSAQCQGRPSHSIGESLSARMCSRTVNSTTQVLLQDCSVSIKQ